MRPIRRPTTLFGVLILVMMLFATPITLYQKIPLARSAVAQLYVQAADDWKAETKKLSRVPSDYYYNGVLVPWQEAIAVDAVVRDQNFKSVDYQAAKNAIKRFTYLYEWTQTECHWHDEDDPPWEHCIEVDYWRYRLKTMEQVMNELGFSADQKNWAREMESRANLLLEKGIRCKYDMNAEEWECTG
ncbi:MAG: hypothetical protein AB2385_05965 [Symbiobacterium sp.]|uniref:hypothetical protein n=1 Tax=Symbiobacterium sp. TaxID=1971213 RepID=UPI0034641CDE